MGSQATRAIVTIRPMEVDDFPKVQEIDHKSTGRFRAPTYEDPLNAWLGGDLSISYVAEVDGDVVGFIFGWLMDAYWLHHSGARIEMIGVDPAHRRAGVGRQLLDAFLRGCRQKGVREIHVLVATHDAGYRAFLDRASFKPSEVVDYVHSTSAQVI